MSPGSKMPLAQNVSSPEWPLPKMFPSALPGITEKLASTYYLRYILQIILNLNVGKYGVEILPMTTQLGSLFLPIVPGRRCKELFK